MNLTVAVLMDPIGAIHAEKDTTLALLLEAQRRGHVLRCMQQGDLAVRDGEAWARLTPLEVRDSNRDWFSLGEPEWQRLADAADIVLARKDPPFDLQFLYDTLVLDLAERAGTRVVNRPQALRDFNEKLAAQWFPQCCAPALVARERAELRRFAREHGEVVLKPLDGMGGRGIFRSRGDDPNLNSILETLAGDDRRFVMAQKFIPEITAGDKRILLVNGEPVPYALARIPQGTDFRGNLAVGGRGVGQPLSERDRWIAAEVGPELTRRGIVLAGLDVIGDYLTEVNVTSPTCARELDAQFGINIGGMVFDAIETSGTRDSGLGVIGRDNSMSALTSHLYTSRAEPRPILLFESRVPSPESRVPKVNAVAAPVSHDGHADRIGVALLFSLVLHAILILGLGFHFAKPAPSLPTLDVTLINTSNAEAPRKADFLAQANNAGGGTSDKARRPGAPFSGPLPVADAGIAPTAVMPAAPARQKASGPHVLTTTGRSDRRVPSERDTRDQPQSERRTAAIPIPQRLEMARLAQEVKREQESYARRPRRKYISANTRETAFAAYQVAWVHRIERIGNLNYPDAARRRHLHGDVMLTVVLGADGHVRDVTVNRSSGYRVLDEAAIRIVHLAAPFPRIPQDRDANGNRYNELVITRTWQFLPGNHLETRAAVLR